MKKNFKLSAVIFAIILLSNSTGLTAGYNEEVKYCIRTGFEKIISSKTKDFISRQFLVKCSPGKIIEAEHRCEMHNRDEVFTFESAEGYKISDAIFQIVSKTARSQVGELNSDGSRATIRLQCNGRECGDRGHVWVSGNITGRLVYQPTVEDAEQIAEACIDKILQ